MLEFVFRDHLRLAVHALVLFVAGLLLAVPVLRWRVRVLILPARGLMRFALGLMGRAPGIARGAGVIFAHNAAVMFLCVASGFHPMLPAILTVWTGINIGVLVKAGDDAPGLLKALQGPPDGWKPGPRLTALAGLLVPLIELPCFWFSAAMGMGMGQRIQAGAALYAEALAERAAAYACVILPLLLVSAVAEAVAIRGMGPPDAATGDG